MGNGISPNSLKIDLEVGPHGIVWLSRHGWGGVEGDDLTTVYEDEISSFDGESWSVHLQPDGEVVGVEVLQDGDVWGAWVSSYAPRQQVTVARLGDAGWEPLPVVLGDGGDLSMAASGDGGMVWLLPGGGQRLQRYDGTGWEEQTTPDVGGEMAADVAPDGTLWVGLSRDCGPGTPGNTPDGGYCIGGYDTLARFDGTDWEVFDASDGVPPTGGHHMMFWGSLEAAPDGSVWFDPTVPQDEVVDTDCDGVANLDGSAVTRYLRGMCIYAMDVGPDGDVWLQAGQPGDDDPLPIHTYVITADAGVASE